MEQRVSSLRFTISPDGKILAIRAEEADGSISTFSFSDEEANVPTSDADFVFRTPAGTVIVDGIAPE